MKVTAWFLRLAYFLGLAILLEASGVAASVNPPALTPHRKARGVTENQHAKRRMRTLARSRAPRSPYARTRSSAAHSSGIRSAGTLYSRTSYSHTSGRRRYYERFHTSSFASDITEGDVTAGEDPVVRQAAVDALGNMNGTVVAIEPTSGRILAMVNQRLALSSGAQPCSTIKLSVALAALSEGVIDEETEVSLGSRSRMNLTEALAHSNNAYFEAVGRKLGFE
ncbi:MAG TPA: penicillin-binding transpeptidase domain-containing protein, partial [Candidatus Acidoferrales bacterium]|nr:penicillin-binding transpeptidase domain-containing protein [Candidatus Acidoferrales bacterium]